MQVHGPSSITDHVEVRGNDGFVAIQIGAVVIYLYTPAEADKIIEALTQVKAILLDAAAKAAGSDH